MNARYTTLKLISGSLLLGAAVSSFAVSFGRMRGAPLIGRNVDVTIPVQLNSGEGLSAVCAEADVFYGDSKLPAERVRLSTTQGSSSSEALVRIQTTQAVNEPVVTIYVREGCPQKTTRKYVLLSEVLSEPAAPQVTTPGETLAGVPALGGGVPAAAGQSSSANASVSPSGPATSSGVRAPTRRGGTSAPARVPAPASASSVAVPSASMTRSQARAAARAATPAGSRLKLEPLDLSIARDPVLRASSEMLSTPTTDEQQRANAAALWAALNAQPQDVLRNNERLKTLEADVAKLVAQGRQTNTAVGGLRSDLEEARKDRFSNWLVYLLGGLLLLLAVLALWLWNARRERDDEDVGNAWWRRGGNEPLDGLEPAQGVASILAEQDGTLPLKKDSRNPSFRSAGSALDVDLDGGSAGGKRKSAAAVPRPAPEPDFKVSSGWKGQSGFQNSMSSMGGRVVNAEELFDVQQQADFFLSLGNAEKAVEVLRHHISENVDTSALAYLDLFELYHSLGREQEYELLRNEFNPLFNAQVPPFSAYTQDTHGLEDYPTALSRIESLWHTPKVLHVIEESIFRKAGSGDEAFSLAAYRELLLLHAIAKRVSDRPSAGAETSTEPATLSKRPASFDRTSIQPLSAELRGGPVSLSGFDATDMDLTRPPASPRLGLDIDLTEDYVPEPELPALIGVAPEEPLPDLSSNLIEFEFDPIDTPPASKKPE